LTAGFGDNRAIIGKECRLIRKALFLFVLCLATSWPIFAWEDCPFGLVNDPRPGKCGLYEDANKDSLCDHSQKNPVLLSRAQDTVVPSGARSATAPKQPKAPIERATPGAGRTAAMPVVSVRTEAAGPDKPASAPAARPPSPLRQRYPLWQIFLITAVLAIVTEALAARDKKLTLPLQAAWNWALGLSFLVTFASSLVYVYPALLVKINFNLSYWHSLAGLVMIAAGLYHLARRFGSMWRGLYTLFKAKTP
jgi:hypothetical protein